MVAILGVPNPDNARPCPNGCGVPVNEMKTPSGTQTIHTGTYRNDCTPRREENTIIH